MGIDPLAEIGSWHHKTAGKQALPNKQQVFCQPSQSVLEAVRPWEASEGKRNRPAYLHRLAHEGTLS